jgi:hypothetical protein
LSLTASALPQKRKIDVVDVATPVPSASAAGGDQNKFVLFSKSTVDYLKAWMSQNADNPFPSTSQKSRIVADTGLNRRQVGDWMARARKKLRVKSGQPNESLAGDRVRPASTPSTEISSVRSLPSDPTNVENLLLELRNQPMLFQESVRENTESVLPARKAEDGSAGKLGISSLIAELESDKHETSTKQFELYMKEWLLRPENADKLYPSLAEKKKIVIATGIDKRRLDGWFFRARKKLNKQNVEPVIHSVLSQPSVLSAATAVIVKAESPNSGTSQMIQHEDLLFMNDPNHSLTAMEVSPKQGSSANSVLNSSINGGKASVNILRSTTGVEKVSLPPSMTAASTEGQNLSDSPNKVLATNILTATMEDTKESDAVKSSSSSPTKGLTEEAKTYLLRWMSEHSLNPYPTKEEKLAMMCHLGISDEKKLEGWFCRARKRQWKKSRSNNPDQKTNESKEDKVKVQGNHILQPPGHNADGLNEMIQTDQNLGSTRVASAQGSSNFASLLSAASLINTETGNPSNQPRVDEPMAHGCEHSQQQTQLSLHPTQNGFTPPDSESNHQSVGAREQAILTTFQSLQSMEIRDRASHTSPADHLPHQQPQQSAPSSSYHNSNVHQRASPAEYMHYPDYSEHSDYSSYQYSRDQQRASPTDHSSFRTSHSPAEYSYQYPKDERASSAEHPHYQYSADPQQRQGFSYPAPPREEFSYGHHTQSDGFYQEKKPYGH